MFELFNEGSCADIVIEESAFSGVVKIAKKVANDIKLVTGVEPEVFSDANQVKNKYAIIAGTIGRSAAIDKAIAMGAKAAQIKGKRECFSFEIIKGDSIGLTYIDKVLLIAGSDKRGTIYGLFHISELMEVSPWVTFADAIPAKKNQVVFTDTDNYVSKEPSVRFRGLFINDEWPAFGNWTFKHFGGFTAKMYDMIFETILRLKGNYLWPAMWTSSFTLDGPGEDNAILADEYGIVMNNSHHEPCLRHSEEWDKVRGEDSIYGNAWNYYTNRDGLLNYWRDGLLRSGKYENIITIGMRGERDSSMLGPDATLTQNIDLLKDIITQQRRLIGECVVNGGANAPQMIALYKEVEAYFYGNEGKHDGLRDWDGLDGVTFMLCEDNFGNMRTLPTADLRDRDGGWGMYYHFDYHGGPISYEWVNSSYLPKVWDQMTKAYEFGIRDIWVVNVGDFKFNEYPLSFFMDMAYDYEKWGVNNIDAPAQYLKKWAAKEFGKSFDEAQLDKLVDVMRSYTKLAHNRKCEAMRTDTYHPVMWNEGGRVLAEVERIAKELEELKSVVKIEDEPHFWELVYYPAMGTLNVQKWNLVAGMNHYFAGVGAIYANTLAKVMDDCKKFDEALTAKMHSLAGGKWDGMGLSKHIGFTNWNDEECRYPVKSVVTPVEGMGLLAYSKEDGDVISAGGDWTGRFIRMTQFARPDKNKGTIVLLNAGTQPAEYTVVCNRPGISFSKTAGTVNELEELEVILDRATFNKEDNGPDFIIKYDRKNIKVVLDIVNLIEMPKIGGLTFFEHGGLVSIEAEHFAGKMDGEGQFKVIPEYGKTLSGVKAFPVEKDFDKDNAPVLEYQIMVENEGRYKLNLMVAPVNPHYAGVNVKSLVVVNGKTVEASFIPEGYNAGECSCPSWSQMVLDQIRVVSLDIELKKGINTIEYMAINPGIVLEKIVLVKEGRFLPNTYLGPAESYFVK